VHHWADLQSVHGFRCYNNIALRGFAIGARDNIVPNAECQRVLVLAVRACLLLCQLRKSLRYLMSNLDDFEPRRDLMSYSDIQLVDRYLLHLLHKFISQVVSLAYSFDSDPCFMKL